MMYGPMHCGATSNGSVRPLDRKHEISEDYMTQTAKTKQFAAENLPPEVQAKADRMNLDEAAVPPYELPALPLADSPNGTKWLSRSAPEIIRQFEKYLYGAIPPRPEAMEFRLLAEAPAFGGLALRREIELIFRHRAQERRAHLLLYLPTGVQGPVPVFFGLNFRGNHATTNDPEAMFHPFTPLPDLHAGPRTQDGRLTESGRGKFQYRWCFETVLKAGCAAATIGYGDFFPDREDGFEPSVMRLFYTPEEWYSPTRPTGAISAWAWGISRALDCLEAQSEIDRTRMMIHGHSRLGKTALWAGACDRRVALTVSNCSGTCGAKLTHRYFGENIEWLDQWNAHWFRADFARWVGRDTEFPIDQHMLMAAIAPRLLYVASADRDVYADPRGEFLAARAASDAWRLCGASGLGDAEFPATGHLIGREIGYYLRPGEHEFLPENWQALLRFAAGHGLAAHA